MRVRMMVGGLVLNVCAMAAMAQMPMSDMHKDSAMETKLKPSVAVDSQLSLIEEEMMGVVKAMPADKFDFAPSAAIFVAGQKAEFTKVRTFGQQAAHVAQANYFLYSTMSGMKPDVNLGALGKMTKKDDIVAALAESFAFAHKAIAMLTEKNAFDAVKINEPGVYTKATLALFGVGHAYDHYGQMVEYLRMNGIVPPASAKM
jgi:uncharacterized damage-inducible protein DinB